MKKIIIFAAIAALTSLVSCQKEEINTNKGDNPVFTASIGGDSRTTVDASTGVVSWEMNDEVTITDNYSRSATYYVSAISEGRATLSFKEGQEFWGDSYSATYGSQPETNQGYSATPGKLYMTAETDTKEFSFDVQCGLLKLNLTSAGQSIKSIAVSDGTTSYGLICSSPVDISEGADFYLALPAGTYTSFTFSNASGYDCVKNPSIVITTNKIKPVTSSNLSFETTPTYPESGTPGVVIDGVCWAPVNCGYDADSAPLGLFYQWGRKYGQSTSGLSYESTAANIKEGSDWSTRNSIFLATDNCWYTNPTISDTWSSYNNPCPAGWRLPSETELVNLTQHGQYDSTLKGRYFSGATVYSEATIKVFFPSAGYSEVGAVKDIDYGYYWTLTPSLDYVNQSACVYFDDTAYPANNYFDFRYFGKSVRCVK